ncbi:MAG: sulfatase-like hydrolase/transferase [Acidobacteriota bacterium]|nr:sulfatase-like hydrolase/transferase [Acidobacteriota bacterium]
MISRRTLLGGLGGLGSALLTPAAPKKPNFVFILADDHAGYVLGCDGNRRAQTPNLDRFAAQGVRFASHYCNSPVCTPSRQSLFTGQLPHMAGVTRLSTPLREDKPTLAKLFQQSGYSTAVFGKMHFNRPGVPGIHGFDVAHTEDVLTRQWQRETARPLPPGAAVKPPWRPLKDPARVWLNADKLPYPRYEADMRASFQVAEAEQFLQSNKDQPFALWVSFLEPHSPYDFPFEYRDKYSPASFMPPKIGPEDAHQIPLIFRDLTDADKQGITAAYYTSVAYLDSNVGRVLNKLHELGLDENTLVVYSADHGYNLGQHGRFEKHCGYDPALRVPLLMRYPGHSRTGVVHDLTEHVDLTSTIADVMQLPELPIRHGRSLRPYLDGKPMQARDHIFSEYLENEEAYIRTETWKFVYCTGKRERKDGYVTDNPTPGRYKLLYDLKNDPGEFRNVAKEHRNTAAELQRLLLDRFQMTHPEAAQEPKRVSDDEVLDWYLRPRDA